MGENILIKEISIQNFQSHKQTSIKFGDGLNVITGSSDSGKSSVLRALMWVVNNRPSGDSIKNWDSSPKDIVQVQLLADNFLINKTRVNGKSTYSYKNEEGDSLYYDAIKTDVPEEIAEELDLSEFNIQTQHQPYFLLNDSGGEIAKKLNDLVGLSVIDNLFKNLNSSILRTDRELHETELSIKEIDESIDSLAYLDSVMGEVDSLELDVKEYDELTESKEDTNINVERYFSIEREKLSYKELIDTEDVVILLSNLIEKEHKELNEIVNNVGQEVERYLFIEEEFESYKKYIDVEEDVNSLLELSDKFIHTRENEIDLRDILDNIIELKTNIRTYMRQEVQLNREYRNLIKENPVCPILKTACKDLENYGT